MIIVPELELLVGKRKIASAVKRLAEEIRSDYRDKNPLVVGILKGAFVFMADLIRHLDIPLEVEFVRLSSYPSGRESSGEVHIVYQLPCQIDNRHVIVVEDIVDTGLTISFLLNNLYTLNPASLKLCALLDKPSRRRAPITIDYLGLTIPDRFLVGYGLDWNERYRYLPAIYYIKGEV